MAASNKKSAIHVLHVDDDPSLQEITKLMLLDLDSGFEIDNACCVDEAQKKLAEGTYDVVVSDYDMPQKNGLELLKELREQNKDIPFILFTGKGREEVAIQALNLGADGYINKQGSPETVYGELAHRLKLAVTANNDKIALRNSEFKFQTIADCANDWIYWLDTEQQFVYVSPSCEKITGYSPEEFYKDSQLINRIIDGQDANLIESHFEEFKDDQMHAIEFKIITKTGMKRCISHICAPVRNEKGSFLGRRATNRDITEQKCAHEAIRKSEEKYRQLVECSTEGIFTIDLSAKVTWANAYGMKLLGYGESDLPISLLKVIPTRYLLKAMRLFSDGLRGKVVTDPFDLEVITKSRERIKVSYRGTLLHDEKGKVTGVLGIIRDFHEKKQVGENSWDIEEQLHFVINVAPVVLWEIDSKGTFTLMEGSALSQVGLQAGELVGQSVFEVYKNEPALLEFIQRGLAGETFVADVQAMGKYWSTHYVPHQDKNETVTKLVITGVDITERKKAEVITKEEIG